MNLVTLNNPVDVITNIPNKVAEIGSKVSDLKDGTVEAIEIIGKLSKMIKLRITPRLEFIKDESVEYASNIENILKNITYSTQEDEEDEE